MKNNHIGSSHAAVHTDRYITFLSCVNQFIKNEFQYHL